MQVDFYQLTRDPAEKILTILAQKILGDNHRLLVVSKNEEQLESISNALWSVPGEGFIANSLAADDKGDEAGNSWQPVLLSREPVAANSAKFIALADGVWCDEALQFERAFYLFAPQRTDDARAAWRLLGDAPDVTRNYWRQDGGKWVKGP